MTEKIRVKQENILMHMSGIPDIGTQKKILH